MELFAAVFGAVLSILGAVIAGKLYIKSLKTEISDKKPTQENAIDIPPAITEQSLASEVDDPSKIIELQLNTLKVYYEETSRQIRIIFYGARSITILGLLILICSIWLLLIGQTTTGMISLIGGLLTELIAGLFLHLYIKSLARVDQLQLKLNVIQQALLAAHLSENLTDNDAKQEVQRDLIQTLTSALQS